METESALTIYIQLRCQVITSFLHFKRQSRVIEPNPNWSTVGLRDCKNDWPWGSVTTATGSTATNRGPTQSLHSPHLWRHSHNSDEGCVASQPVPVLQAINAARNKFRRQPPERERERKRERKADDCKHWPTVSTTIARHVR